MDRRNRGRQVKEKGNVDSRNREMEVMEKGMWIGGEKGMWVGGIVGWRLRKKGIWTAGTEGWRLGKEECGQEGERGMWAGGTEGCRIGKMECGQGFLNPLPIIKPQTGIVLPPKGTIPGCSQSPGERENPAFIRSEVGHIPPEDAVAFQREKGSSRSQSLLSFPKKHQGICSSPVRPEITSGDNISTRLGARLWNSTCPCPALWKINLGILMSVPASRDGNLLKSRGNRQGKARRGRGQDLFSMENVGRTWVLGM